MGAGRCSGVLAVEEERSVSADICLEAIDSWDSGSAGCRARKNGTYLLHGLRRLACAES